MFGRVIVTHNKRFNTCMVFADPVKGYDDLWIVGDNFLVKTYWPYFKIPERDHSFFMTDEYEVYPICNSKFNSADGNLLSRLCNIVVTALNTKPKIPKYCLIILDEDLMKYLDFCEVRVATMYGEWVDWIVKEIHSLFVDKKAKLPKKAVKDDYPFIYWVALPNHRNLRYYDQRRKFNLCLESVVRLFDNMRVIKLKEFWDDSPSLVIDGKLSPHALSIYWKSIDSSFKFNVQKHSEYIQSHTGKAWMATKKGGWH